MKRILRLFMILLSLAICEKSTKAAPFELEAQIKKYSESTEQYIRHLQTQFEIHASANQKIPYLKIGSFGVVAAPLVYLGTLQITYLIEYYLHTYDHYLECTEAQVFEYSRCNFLFKSLLSAPFAYLVSTLAANSPFFSMEKFDQAVKKAFEAFLAWRNSEHYRLTQVMGERLEKEGRELYLRRAELVKLSRQERIEIFKTASLAGQVPLMRAVLIETDPEKKDILNRFPKESDRCHICFNSWGGFETEGSVVISDCEHFFHSQCIRNWSATHAFCPICHTKHILLTDLYKIWNNSVTPTAEDSILFECEVPPS